jgi:integrase
MPKIRGIPKVRFNLLDKRQKETYVVLFFHYRGHRLRYYTGDRVEPRWWDFKTQRPRFTGKHPEYAEMHSKLNRLDELVVSIFRERDMGAIEPEAFRKELDYCMGIAPRPDEIAAPAKPTLPEFASAYYKERAGQPNANPGTMAVVKRAALYLWEYAHDRRAKLPFEDANLAFFNDFQAWLFSKKHGSTNYVHRTISSVKSLLREAKRRGYHTNTAYDDFSMKKEKMAKIVLSIAELRALSDLDLSDDSRLEKVRDLFIVGAFTGLRFSDFSRIRPEHIVGQADERMIEIVTQKTGEKVFVPLFPEAEAVLKRWDFRVPGISNQKMNDYLKELGQLAGMTETVLLVDTTGGIRREKEAAKWTLLTTHVARRSFATNMYRLGIPAHEIMKVTGHRTESAFRDYIVLDGKTAAMDFMKRAKTAGLLPTKLKKVG